MRANVNVYQVSLTMMIRNNVSLHALLIGGLVGWAVLITMAGAFVVFKAATPEIGPFGLFLLWSGILSAFYIVDFLIITLPFHIVFHPHLSPIRRLLWSAMGGLLFGLSVPLWSLIVGHTTAGDIILHGGLGFISGSITFFAATRRQT
jgi:hypothetical protein